MTVRNESSVGSGKRADWVVPSEGASTNSSALTAASAKADAAALPSTDASAGRYVFADESIVNSTLCRLKFALTDADNETASAHVWGWQRRTDGYYEAELLAVVAITAGAKTGVSGATISDSFYYADRVTVSTNNTPRDTETFAATDAAESVVLDHGGSDAIEVEVTTNSGTAASVLPYMRGH